MTTHTLENLTMGAKYYISLAGVTRKGEGPNATVIINTLPEKSVNGTRLAESTPLLKNHYL